MRRKPLVSFDEAVREMRSAPRPHDRPELKGSTPLILDLIEALEKSVSIPDDETDDETPTRKRSVPDAS